MCSTPPTRGATICTAAMMASVMLLGCAGDSARPPFSVEFESAVVFASNATPDKVVLGDANDDGDVDVASLFRAAGLVRIHRLSGDPAEPSRWTTFDVATGLSALDDIVFANVLGDASPELVVAAAGTLRAYTPTADDLAGWTVRELTLDRTLASIGGLRTADIDRDGDTDLVVRINGQPDNQADLAWIQNPPDDNGTWRVTLLRRETMSIEAQQPVDVDRDGDLDLVNIISQTDADILFWLENPYDSDEPDLVRDPAEWTRRDIANVSSRAVDLAVAAGTVELFVLDSAGQVTFVAQETTGANPRWQSQQVTETDPPAIGIASADLNGDGQADVLTWQTVDGVGQLRWLGRQGDSGSIVRWGLSFLADTDPAATIGRVAAGDLDGDGDNDVVAPLAAAGGQSRIAALVNVEPDTPSAAGRPVATGTPAATPTP